jgi:hypothetical protein
MIAFLRCLGQCPNTGQKRFYEEKNEDGRMGKRFVTKTFGGFAVKNLQIPVIFRNLKVNTDAHYFFRYL